MVRGAGTTITVGGHTVTLTNPDKIMYPQSGTTKADVVAYYRAVAPWFTAHNGRRPATRQRWVNGVGTADLPGKVFFSKDVDSGTPDWVATTVLAHRDRDAVYPLIEDEATLVWLAQISALEMHVPQWRVGPSANVRSNPDRLVLDLDPGDGAGLPECVHVAHLCRDILDGMGLACVPVTSGSKGIHLYAGLDGRVSAQNATLVARELARSLEADHPDLVVSDMKRSLRDGKVFLDWSQNNGNKTTVAPYSLRGRLRPWVAAPRAWEEMTPDVAQLEYPEVLERLRTRGDLLAPLLPLGAQPPTRLIAAPPREATLAVQRVPVPEPTELPRIQAMLATLGSAADVSAGEWAYETKWDGYRAIAEITPKAATFRSRNGNDLSAAYPELQELSALLVDHTAVLDGEIVAVDADGRSDFGLLQNRGDPGAQIRVHYMAFDVLHLDGHSLLRLPYRERRQILESLPIDGRHVHVPATFGTDRALALTTSRELRLEGVIAKTIDGVYRPGARARTWIKIKNLRAQEVIVVGWTPGAGRRAGQVGSLLLAVPDGEGLSYVGKVGTGFTDRALADIGERLRRIQRTAPPLDDVPRADAKGAHWTDPTLVGEVAYAEWTSSGRLRHPAWRGWRTDKAPGEVRRAEG